MKRNNLFHHGAQQTTGWRLLAISLLATSTLVFSACKKEEVEVGAIPKVAVESPTLQRLLGMGFDPKRIDDKGDYFVVEGDIRFDKEKSSASPTTDGVIVKHQDQAHTYSLIDVSRFSYISVGFAPSFPSAWVSDMQQAVMDWGAINGKSIRFTVVGANAADITFKSAPLTGLYGLAEFPANGAPGKTVTIDPGIPSSLRHLVFVHEMGHCFGFRHTDLYTNGEGAGPDGGVLIPETPSQDYNSVMNSGGAPNQSRGWVGFSGYDVIGCQHLYPIFAPAGYWDGRGGFKIVSKNSGLALSSNYSYAEGSPLAQDNYNNTGYLSWTLQDVGGGYFKITSFFNGYVVALDNSSTSTTKPIIQRTYVGDGYDQWSMQEVGQGYYKIKCRNTGQVLNVQNNSLAAGAPIVQYPYAGAGNDQWSVQPM